MKLAKIKNRIKSVVMASALGLALLAGFPAVEAQAATGSVYTCTINRSYSNPVNGTGRGCWRCKLVCHRTGNGRRMRLSNWLVRIDG